ACPSSSAVVAAGPEPARAAGKLLGDAGGFESSVPRSLEVYVNYLVPPEPEEDEDRVVRVSAAELSRAALTTSREDSVFAEILELLGLDPVVTPLLEDLEHA